MTEAEAVALATIQAAIAALNDDATARRVLRAAGGGGAEPQEPIRREPLRAGMEQFNQRIRTEAAAMAREMAQDEARQVGVWLEWLIRAEYARRRTGIAHPSVPRAAAWIRGLAELPQEIRLHAGELTADEMRVVRAVLRFVAWKIEEL